MSATFKLAKKKYTQNDLRRLMSEQKAKTKQDQSIQQRIDSPLAKYNAQGQLTCVLCKSIVRSESVWKVHINTKAHKENVEAAKQLKVQIEQANRNKRLGIINMSSAVPEKRLKLEEDGIFLKPAIPGKKGSLPEDFFDSKATSKTYFEATLNKTSIKAELVNINRGPKEHDDPVPLPTNAKDEILPEGFFDDPIKDAKIRNLDYKDPHDEEWDRFQKEIKEQSTVSMEIVAEDREEATAERIIEEIDEQIRKWNKVLEMEKKKEAVVSKKLLNRPQSIRNGSTISDDDESQSDEDITDNIDEFLDWRAKKSSL